MASSPPTTGGRTGFSSSTPTEREACPDPQDHGDVHVLSPDGEARVLRRRHYLRRQRRRKRTASTRAERRVPRSELVAGRAESNLHPPPAHEEDPARHGPAGAGARSLCHERRRERAAEPHPHPDHERRLGGHLGEKQLEKLEAT
jgi:hypothetical protein